MLAWKTALFLLAAITLWANPLPPSITWDGDLTENGTGSLLPVQTGDGFVMNVLALGPSIASVNSSAFEEFTVNSAGTFTLTNSVGLNFSGFNCNPGACPDSLSGSYTASSSLGPALTNSKSEPFPQGITLLSFNLDGSGTQTLDLTAGNYFLETSLIASANGGDVEVGGYDSVTITPGSTVPEPRWIAAFLCLVIFAGVATQKLRSSVTE